MLGKGRDTNVACVSAFAALITRAADTTAEDSAAVERHHIHKEVYVFANSVGDLILMQV